MANYYVAKNGKGGWDSARDRSERASKVSSTQRQAIKEAKRLCAKSGGGEVRVHGENGKIINSDTVPPGNDPFPPRDKK